MTEDPDDLDDLKALEEFQDAYPRAKPPWIVAGLALLVAAGILPPTPLGAGLLIAASLGLVAWTFVTYPRLPWDMLFQQVVIFNIPLLAWWGMLALIIPIGAWIGPAVAVFAASYSFSFAAINLCFWVTERPKGPSWLLLIMAGASLGLAAYLLLTTPHTAGASRIVGAAAMATIAILFQRLMAFLMEDQDREWHAKIFSVLAFPLVLVLIVRAGALHEIILPVAGGFLVVTSMVTIVLAGIALVRPKIPDTYVD